MAGKLNPIPFNPMGLTARQLVECADALSTAFDGIERGVLDANIIYNLCVSRDNLRVQWDTRSR